MISADRLLLDAKASLTSTCCMQVISADDLLLSTAIIGDHLLKATTAMNMSPVCMGAIPEDLLAIRPTSTVKHSKGLL